MPPEMICDIFRVEGLANYFTVTECIEELKELQNIIQSDNGELELTKKGLDAAEVLERRLLPTVRKIAVQTALSFMSKAQKLKENTAVIKKTDDGYLLTLETLDGQKKMMSISVNLSDNTQAEFIKEEFLQNPARIYEKVLQILIGNDIF